MTMVPMVLVTVAAVSLTTPQAQRQSAVNFRCNPLGVAVILR